MRQAAPHVSVAAFALIAALHAVLLLSTLALPATLAVIAPPQSAA
jgi:hypothetical protein